MAMLVTCTCGKQLKIKEEFAGKRGKCVACGRTLLIPAPPEPAGGDTHRPSAPRACPTCHKPLRPEAVLCVNCGFDLRTGKKVTPATTSASITPSEPLDRDSDEASTPWLRNALIVGAICLAIVSGAALLLYWSTWAGKPAPVAKSNPEPLVAAPLTPSTAVPSSQPPKATGDPGVPTTALVPFEQAFREGRIAWQPVKNIQLTTKTAGGHTKESFEFVTKLKYDTTGKASVDTTGQKTYSWPDREATFGPEAIIRITQDANVREGPIRAGDEWTWTGQQWIMKLK
jgi:hypothetical protein